MANQPRYDPFEPSTFFTDGQSARHPVPGTVPRGQLRDDAHLFTGRSDADQAEQEQQAPAETFPFPVTRAVLERGRERYTIFCAPCHGRLGYGDGMVVERGFPAPPSFHTDRLREAPVGHFFQVVTTGQGPMPSYADQVPVRDRWAIIAHIQALQLSQRAEIPVEQAIERLAEQGLPVRPDHERQEVRDRGLGLPADWSSGRTLEQVQP